MRLQKKAIGDFTVGLAIAIILWQVFSVATGMSFFFQKCPQVEFKDVYLAVLSADKADVNTQEMKSSNSSKDEVDILRGKSNSTIIIDEDTEIGELGLKKSLRVFPERDGWTNRGVVLVKLEKEFLAKFVKNKDSN